MEITQPPSVIPPFIIKVCGITTREDGQAALDAGVNALGFNFYSASPRFVDPIAAADIAHALRGTFLRVGVFVHPTPADIEAALPFLDVLQIHGQPPTQTFQLPIWRAIPAGVIPSPDSAVKAWLLDSFTPAFGGSGQTFDWSLAAAFPYPVIVAGGLDATNVAQAINVASPWGVDACSRLESVPGRKDHAQVAAFAAQARQAFHARQAVSSTR